MTCNGVEGQYFNQASRLLCPRGLTKGPITVVDNETYSVRLRLSYFFGTTGAPYRNEMLGPEHRARFPSTIRRLPCDLLKH